MPLPGRLWVLGQAYDGQRATDWRTYAATYKFDLHSLRPEELARCRETEEQYAERRCREDRIERLWNGMTLFETIQ